MAKWYAYRYNIWYTGRTDRSGSVSARRSRQYRYTALAVPATHTRRGDDPRKRLPAQGQQNKALSAIYEQGKTPKTLDWLNQALRKVGIQQ